MDQQTLESYNQEAAQLCATYRSSTPHNLYRCIQQHFHCGLSTADIGCGSGRDVVWLTSNGYPTTGYDGSPAMLAEARRCYPQIEVREATLPLLTPIPNNTYANVLCCATLMHLPHRELATAVGELARILCPDGRVIISYLATPTTMRRADGRLYTALSVDALPTLLVGVGMRLLAAEEQADAAREGMVWYTLAGGM
jgi:SAM-dependent methyltransferase